MYMKTEDCIVCTSTQHAIQFMSTNANEIYSNFNQVDNLIDILHGWCKILESFGHLRLHICSLRCFIGPKRSGDYNISLDKDGAERESFHIDQFNLVYRGMNKKR